MPERGPGVIRVSRAGYDGCYRSGGHSPPEAPTQVAPEVSEELLAGHAHRSTHWRLCRLGQTSTALTSEIHLGAMLDSAQDFEDRPHRHLGHHGSERTAPGLLVE